MTWPPEQHETTDVSWTLQVQYRHDGWWSDHTANLNREDADTLMAERQAAHPRLHYRLVRVTTTRVVEQRAATEQEDGVQSSPPPA